MIRRKRKLKKRVKFIIFLLIVAFIIFCGLYTFNVVIEPQIRKIAVNKANNALNMIIDKVLSEDSFDTTDLITKSTNKDGNIVEISYNTKKMNEIQKIATTRINESLMAAVKGNVDPFLGEVFFEDGIVYEMPLLFLTKINLIDSYGPNIPITMRADPLASAEVVIDSKPYGYNNTIIEISLEVKVAVQVVADDRSIDELEVKNKIPLVIQVVNGDVANYIPYINSK